MEINVSRLARTGGVSPFDVSRSRAEAGPDAGPSSWRNALAGGRKPRPLLRRRQCQDVRDYFAGFGAWDAAERAAWTWDDCCALVLQFAAGDLRNAQALCPGKGVAGVDWDAYQAEAERGRLSGSLFPQAGRLYFTLDA